MDMRGGSKTLRPEPYTIQIAEVPVSPSSPSAPDPALTDLPLVGDIDLEAAVSLGRVSAVLVVDSSGSMTTSDPQGERVDAGKVFLSASRLRDEVGVVDFDHQRM